MYARKNDKYQPPNSYDQDMMCSNENASSDHLYTLQDAHKDFKAILKKLDGNSTMDFITQLREHLDTIDIESPSHNADILLKSISEDLRNHPDLPLSAVMNSELIIHPSTGEFAGLEPGSVVNVDKFLYPDDESIDELCEQGKLSRNYCVQCGSHQVEPLTFVSHSASTQQMKYLFKDFLPDLHDKTVIDVGSRLGVVLYHAYHYSSASNIIGVEMNPDLCGLQQYILQKYSMEDRIQVTCADIRTQAYLLKKADVLILNNVFEFFLNVHDQKEVWKFLFENYRKSGSYLVSIPSIAESLAPLGLILDVNTWVKEFPISMKGRVNISNEEEEEELSCIHLYKVL
ncbi:hypothetical protein HOLleu_08463 [Holothuria leucospilota]|uniref:Uncharacterized protein n=1 Tax=Holothuria leucospilota TaxID=206669 RepID=A0A9Q1HGZ5_HOLLE|nr:hypothetical protein HOLleu_08463 [Holothuria leucospilota]